MQTSKSYRVLVVEDEGLIAADIARRLESLGHTVAGTASTADEALELCAAAEVVLMDVRLDGPRDGIDAANEIRARYRIPVIFLTAHADRATLDRAKVSGPFGYLVKPLGPAALQAALEIAVYKHTMERRLEEQEAWFRATLASTAQAMVVADAGGHVLLLNRAAEALTGWTQPEAKGRALDALLPIRGERAGSGMGDLATLATLRDDVVDLPQGSLLEARDGSLIPIDATISPVKAEAGVLGVAVALRDISVRQREEAQFRQSQRLEAAARLAAGLAPEYGSLIGSIRNQAAQLMAQFGHFPPAKCALEEISRAAMQADQVTRRLEAFGLRQPQNPEIVSLNGILRSLGRALEAAAGAGLSVTIRPATNAGKIRADAAQLEQAIMYAVLHACAVTPAGGSLKLETSNSSRRGDWAVLRIAYSGEEADPERLFDPTPDGESGLTLATAHAIVAEMDGRISARRSPDGGTLVEMLLPVAETAEPLATGQTRTILFIDPRERVREHLHNVFEARGYHLLDAITPEEAIALAELHESPVDLLIADEEDAAAALAGLEAARSSPQNLPLQVLRIVQADEKSVYQLRRPFTEQALMERIAQLLEPPKAAHAVTSS
jgi:two-component system cell cycle sensor histidine kinase/response regulator CckA